MGNTKDLQKKGTSKKVILEETQHIQLLVAWRPNPVNLKKLNKTSKMTDSLNIPSNKEIPKMTTSLVIDRYVASVSYTHLDVYKRQENDSAEGNEPPNKDESMNLVEMYCGV